MSALQNSAANGDASSEPEEEKYPDPPASAAAATSVEVNNDEPDNEQPDNEDAEQQAPSSVASTPRNAVYKSNIPVIEVSGPDAEEKTRQEEYDNIINQQQTRLRKLNAKDKAKGRVQSQASTVLFLTPDDAIEAMFRLSFYAPLANPVEKQPLLRLFSRAKISKNEPEGTVVQEWLSKDEIVWISDFLLTMPDKNYYEKYQKARQILHSKADTLEQNISYYKMDCALFWTDHELCRMRVARYDSERKFEDQMKAMKANKTEDNGSEEFENVKKRFVKFIQKLVYGEPQESEFHKQSWWELLVTAAQTINEFVAKATQLPSEQQPTTQRAAFLSAVATLLLRLVTNKKTNDGDAFKGTVAVDINLFPQNKKDPSPQRTRQWQVACFVRDWMDSIEESADPVKFEAYTKQVEQGIPPLQEQGEIKLSESALWGDFVNAPYDSRLAAYNGLQNKLPKPESTSRKNKKNDKLAAAVAKAKAEARVETDAAEAEAAEAEAAEAAAVVTSSAADSASSSAVPVISSVRQQPQQNVRRVYKRAPLAPRPKLTAKQQLLLHWILHT